MEIANLPTLAYPSLQLLLQRYLSQVIYPKDDVSKGDTAEILLPTLDIPGNEAFLRVERTLSIPLNRVKDKTQILYVSAIALKLEKVCQVAAMTIAHSLARHFYSLTENRNNAYLADPFIKSLRMFDIAVRTPGWVDWRVMEGGLAQWLDAVSEASLLWRSRSCQRFYPSENVFIWQYTHARCCSLLRLADQEGIVTFWGKGDPSDRGDGAGFNARIIPWIDEKGQFQLKHPTEQGLISQLVTLLDLLGEIDCAREENRPKQAEWLKQWMKAGTLLCQEFEAFTAQCRILGQVKQEQRSLAQARVGLIRVTQQLLQHLLEDWLQQPAPDSL